MFAELYHAHHSSYTADLPFWLHLAEQQGGAILELGCGTGRVLRPLAYAGHKVFGLDRDAKMLTVLRAEIQGIDGGDIRVFQADLTSYHLVTKFSLILLPCNLYSTLSGLDRRAALARARKHLSPGGLFVVSLPNPSLLIDLPEEAQPEVEHVFTHSHTGHPVQVSSAWSRKTDHVDVVWHYDHLFPDGRVERHTQHTVHSLDTALQYQDECLGAGFTSLKTFGDFDRSPYHQASPHLILIAAY